MDVLEKRRKNLHQRGEERLAGNVEFVGLFGFFDGELCAFGADIEPNSPCALSN